MSEAVRFKKFGVGFSCSAAVAARFRRWAEWGRTGNLLIEERLVEATFGENPRLAAAEAAHSQAIEALAEGEQE